MTQVIGFSKSNPTPSAVHVDSVLTNTSIAFLQSAETFIADKVFPVVNVNKQSDKYFTYPVGTFYRDSAKKRAPGAEAPVGGYDVSTDTYYCDVYAFAHDVDWQRRANEDVPLDSFIDGTNLVTHAHLIKREREFATTALATSTWGTDITGVASSPSTGQVIQWSDYTNSNPVKNIRDGIRAVHAKTGFKPNTLVLTADVYYTLLDHPDLIERIDNGQTSGPALVTDQTMKAVFGVQNLFVMNAVFNSAAEGQADSNNFIATKKALLCYVNAAPSIRMPSAGYTYNWSTYLRGGPIVIDRFEIRQKKVERIEGEMAFDHKVVSADLGYLFNDIIA